MRQPSGLVRLGRVLGAGGVLGALAMPGQAGTLAQRESALALERAHAAAHAGRPASALEALLGRLRADDAIHRRRFAAAEGRHLHPRATSRLAAARSAYANGQGRLLELVERAAASPDAGGQAAILAEASSLQALIEAASAPLPISAEARLRPPRLVTPPLPTAPSPEAMLTPEAPESPVIGNVPGALREMADSLAGPIEVFEWVRNEMRPEFYHGLMKGALQAFRERGGNDADTAAVLIEMLRAKGVPARFARGVAEVRAPALIALTGTANIQQAVRVVARAGIPHETIAGPGGIGSVRIHRVWVEAYLPYANYRGAVIDSQGSVWLSLDAAFKPMRAPSGLDVVGALGFEPRQALDEYLASPQVQTPTAFVRERVGQLLAAQLPGTSYEDVLNRRAFAPQRLGLLPSTLPYKVVTLAGVSYDIDQDLRHRIRVVGEDAEGVLFDFAVDSSEVVGHRLTLAYEPETEEDAQVVASYGSLHLTPPYLVNVRPILKSGGLPVAAGSRGIGMAVRYALRLELAAPGGVESVTNQVQAANLLAIGLSGRAADAATVVPAADQILASVAARYFERWNISDDALADLMRVVPVRPTLSACLAQSDVEVEYAGGDPLHPLDFEWKGILIDADLRASAPVGLETPESESRFLLLSGLEGSVLEDRVFSEELGVAAVSTAGALALASGQGLTVHDLTAENVDDVLPTLPFDASVKEEIRDAALGGMLVRVPSGFVTRLAWRGVGYLLLDEESGEAAWQLQGGHSGGVTAPAVIDIPEELRDPLIEQGQGIEAAPEDAQVRSIQKFVSTDFQEGTVNQRVERPLRVLVTDEEGRAVRNANVVFSVVGGGSLLKDPAVGGEPRAEVTIRSNAEGEAEVIQILGTRTDVIPRLLVFPEQPELNPIQVGLNLVTARAGSATLAEPFSTFALPDFQFDGENGIAYLEWMPYSGNWHWPQLSVGARLGMTVSDQYGNPLSNVQVRFTPRPPPYTQEPPPPFYTLMRPATDTPARVLTTADYDRCLTQHLQPHYGECEGEAATILTRSTYLGVFAFPVFGDSSWTYYHYDVATLEPVGWRAIGMPAWVCARPDLSQCAGHEGPSPVFVTTGVRPKRVNRIGNFIEAYPLGGEGPFAMWADAYSEIERVEQVTDPEGNVHFMAFGTNAWRRERLIDSEIHLEPSTPDTQVLPEIANTQGDGSYVATIRMATTPQLNKVSIDGKHWPLRLAYLPNRYPELDPAHVNQVTLEAERIQILDEPLSLSGSFDLWGIRASLTGLHPTPITVGPEGTVSQPSTVTARIEPEVYRALLVQDDVEFQVRREGQPVLAANGATGAFEVPVGLPFPDDAHDAVLSVVGVSMAVPGTGFQNVTSDPLDLPRCGLLNLETPYVPIPMAVDFVNATTCAQDGLLKFELCDAARVTLRVDGSVFEGELRGLSEPVLSVRIEDLELPAGAYTVVFPPTYLGPDVLAEKPFVVTATSLVDQRQEAAPGIVANSAKNRAVLPVGRTFVKGVDLLDGHLVRSHADLEIPGRHLSLNVQRTYSSAGHDRSGVLGAGWAFSYESRLYVTDCGVILQTADGSSQMFRSSDGGQTFAPQKGYHGRLVKNPDLSYDFFDKAGNRHHFGSPNQPLEPEGNRQLLYIEEPHGDRIVLAYDNAPRLVQVSEVHPESSMPVRQLDIRHVRRGGFDRISSIRAEGLGLTVDYEYDEWGNLKEVRRNGPPLWRERYQYSVVNVRDRHQLLEVIDANGHVTRYEYYQAGDLFAGQSSAPLQVHNDEYVRRVVSAVGGGAGNVSTEFAYDLSDVLSLRWQTTVRDGRGVDTRYVLNGNGSDLERHEAVGTPLERLTVSEWAETDIFKVRTTDPAGRVTEFGHDANGNLTSEEIHTPDLGVVRRSWVYGPFNRLVAETDAASRTTTFEIDPENGDLLSKTDATGNATRFEYGVGHGLVTREINPRGHVTDHSDHDSFGNGRRVQGPEGRVVQRSFDGRGRLIGEQDSLGHQLAQNWDGLDRVVERRRVSGSGTTSDEAYTWEYYAGGQKRSETNPLGARTEFTLDGLDRVVLERTTFGSEVLTVERSYDANGNVILEKDRRGVRRAWTYDELDRPIGLRVVDGPAPAPTGPLATYGYDQVDRKLFEIDLGGLRSDFEYDGLHRVTKKLLPETCPQGRCFEEYRYDLVGNRTFLRDHGGFTETSSYDGLNRITSFTDRAGRTRTTEYDDPEGSHLNKSVERDPFGLVTTYLYDGLNRETSRIATLTGGGSQGEIYSTLTAYDDSAHAVVVTDPRRMHTRRELDGLDRVTRQVVDVDGLALVTRFGWNGLSLQTSTRDPEGHLTESLYDALGRLREVEDALGRRAVYAYDGGGLRTRETDRRGVRTDLAYDNVGRLISTSVVPSLTANPWSASTAYLDPARRRVLTDARGRQTTIELDGLDRSVRTIAADGQETRTEWLGIHDRRERDRRGFWRELRFDGVGRPTLARDPVPWDHQAVTISYDDANNRVSETDRRGIVRVTQRDSLQRLRSVTRAGLVLEEHGYDGNGNRLSSKDGAGRETRFEYDAANRMVVRTDGFGTAEAAATTFEHDRDGNVTLERDQRAADLNEPFSLRRSFDALHRVSSITDGEGHVTAYGYGEEGHRTSVTEPGLQVTTFEYGEKGELTHVMQPSVSGSGPATTRVIYDEARNPTTQVDARMSEVLMIWDDLGRLDQRGQKVTGTMILTTAFAYDPNGNQTRLTDPKSQTVTQEFDELNRLKKKTWTFAPTDPHRPWRFTTSATHCWDPNGNLVQVVEEVGSGLESAPAATRSPGGACPP